MITVVRRYESLNSVGLGANCEFISGRSDGIAQAHFTHDGMVAGGLFRRRAVLPVHWHLGDGSKCRMFCRIQRGAATGAGSERQGQSAGWQ